MIITKPCIRDIIGIFSLFGSVFFLTSCFHSKLSNPPIRESHFKLAAMSGQRLGLKTESSVVSDDRLGSQFVFFALPAGKFTLPDPALYIERRAFEALSEIGYRPIIGEPWSEREKRRIVVNLVDLSVSGYDYFLTRKLTCTVNLEGVLLDSDRGVLASYGTSEQLSKLRKSAFASDLQPLLDEAVTNALKKLFMGMHL